MSVTEGPDEKDEPLRSKAATDSLPLVDVHSIDLGASEDSAWRGLTSLLKAASDRWAWPAFATILGCSDRKSTGRLGTVGATIPGFRVTASDPPTMLRLDGRHRFSRYALTFTVEPRGPLRSRVFAESRAIFPGRLGTVYRILVLGSRGHVVAVNGLLRHIKQIAEEGPLADR